MVRIGRRDGLLGSSSMAICRRHHRMPVGVGSHRVACLCSRMVDSIGDPGRRLHTFSGISGFLCGRPGAIYARCFDETLFAPRIQRDCRAIWANRDSFLDGRRPLAQKLVVTVLFTDLKGFSTLSEHMEPARLYVWLNGYLGAMAQVIQNHGGVLKQFTGDGILALFGVPVPHTTPEAQSKDAMAAVRCALALGTRLVELLPAWQEQGLPVVSMRAGIYTGEVAAGSVGSDDRFEYAVIGDVVNTASRLESYDKTLANPDSLPNRCRVLIGAPTHDLLNGRFGSKPIGLLEVKGKVNKVPVFQILDEKPANASDERELPGLGMEQARESRTATSLQKAT